MIITRIAARKLSCSVLFHEMLLFSLQARATTVVSRCTMHVHQTLHWIRQRLPCFCTPRFEEATKFENSWKKNETSFSLNLVPQSDRGG